MYIATESTKHIKLQLQNGHITKIRNGDFHPMVHRRDPTKTHTNAFSSIRKRLLVVPTVIKTGTDPPVNLTHALKYSDAEKWKVAHDLALKKLELEQVVDWHHSAPKVEQPLPLTISCAYKWDPDGAVQTRKTLCLVGGDLMKSCVHFDPEKVQCPTAEKATIPLLIFIAAAHGWHL